MRSEFCSIQIMEFPALSERCKAPFFSMVIY